MSRDAWILIGVLVAIVGIITLVIALRMLWRLFAVKKALNDAGASGKWVFWGALAYLVFPIDILPDPIYIDDVAVVGGALFFLTRLLKKQETLKGAIPHAQRVVGQVAARKRRPDQLPRR
jgi:uncharacterized membrane protein YkvA (DUF1232 family)